MIETTTNDYLNNLKLPQVIKPPVSLPSSFEMLAVFLTGSKEQGVAKDWRTELIEFF